MNEPVKTSLNFKDEYKSFGSSLENNLDMQPFQARASDVSVRPEFTKNDYEKYRPSERIPTGDTADELRKIMLLCISAYERVGVIRSVIDMMSEFGAEGIQIIHPDEAPNAFYKAWSKKINLEDRVERGLNWCFKAGQMVVRRQYGQVEQTDLTRHKDIDIKDNKSTDRHGYIPLRYVFYNPADIEVIGGKASSYSTEQRYALRLPTKYLTDAVKFGGIDTDVIAGLPIEIRNIFTNEQVSKYNTWLIPLDPTRIHVGFYKKDDDQIWAKSFIYAILSDVFYNDKVKQAKLSTMDNMISIIRLWKLGDHTHELLPSPSLGAKLANIISNHTGGGPIDIIWDSTLQLEEFYPPIDKLANFTESYHGILLGLGVPESLVGGSTDKSNMTSNSLGFKNLIKRLEAGRRIITEWLNAEIDIIQKNMGFRKRPYIRFANEDLYDERTYYNLLLQLVDRNILSDERILEVIDEIPEIERMRIKKENAVRGIDNSPEKASPYHNPQLELQQKHETKIQKQQMENSNNLSKQKEKESTKKNGRPVNSPDKVKRSRGPSRTKSIGSSLVLEANRIYNFIDDFATQIAFSEFNLTDIRSMTGEQKEFLDGLKSDLFAVTPPDSELTPENVLAFYNENNDILEEFNEEYLDNLNKSKATIEDRGYYGYLHI